MVNKLRITVKQRRSQFSEPVLRSDNTTQMVNKYRIVTYVTAVDIINGLGEAQKSPDIPVELFLYQKSNSVVGSTEKLVGSTFVRLPEPSDFSTSNPTLFGTEKRKWVRDPWTKDFASDLVLVPSQSPNGTDPQLSGSDQTLAPGNTYMSSAYYVSRVHVIESENMDLATNGASAILTSIRAFQTKVNTILENTFEGQAPDVWVEHTIG